VLKKKIYILIPSIVIPIAVFFAITADYAENNVQNISEPTKLAYIPSDITKANPNFVMGNDQSLWYTLDIKEIKDQVAYTIQGTVLSIGDPVVWVRETLTWVLIPITISAENVYKGDWTDETFTFYVLGHTAADKIVLFSDVPHFEIGENVLVHLSHYKLGEKDLAHLEPDENSPFPDGHYYVKLSQFGKYQLHEIVDAAITQSNDSNTLAFNVLHPDGIPLDVVSGEALP